MNFDWVEDFLEAPGLLPHVLYQGHYNTNYVVHPPGEAQPMLVRVPNPDAPQMDLRMLDESAVLRFLGSTSLNAPLLLYEDPIGRYRILGYIPGIALGQTYPSGTLLNDQVVCEIARLIRHIHALQPPTEFRCQVAEAGALIDFVEKLYLRECLVGHEGLFVGLGFPESGQLVPAWLKSALMGELHPLVFAHCDIHRTNLIIRPDGVLVPVDWELAAVCDPAFDVASHFHRSGYTESQQSIFFTEYGLQGEELKELILRVKLYGHLEILKSVVVDSLRTLSRLRTDTMGALLPTKLRRLTDRLAAADRLWSIQRDRSESETRDALVRGEPAPR